MKTMIVTLIFILSTSYSYATSVGTITAIDGKVELLTNPRSQPGNEGPNALYDGTYYTYREAKPGDKLENGNVIRTEPGAKAKIIYDNGDQIGVGPATAFKINWSGSDKTQINMKFGKIRSIVQNNGPRKGLTIKTKTATMGVRGTDFFVSDYDEKKGTEVAVLRGSVSVKSEQKKAAPPVEVKQGHVAEIQSAAPKKDEKKPTPAVAVRKTTKEEIVVIHAVSDVKKAAEDEIKTKEDVKKINDLEKKAVEMTINDIKKAQPELISKIDTKNIATSQDLNAITMKALYKEAPAAPKKDPKPFERDLDKLDYDTYDKFFRIKD